MKTVGIVLCTVATALGVILGRMDFEAERRASGETSHALALDATRRPAGKTPSNSSWSAPAEEVVASSTETDTEPSRVEAQRERRRAPVVPAAGREDSSSSEPTSRELKTRADKLAVLIAARDFQAARDGAAQLARDTEKGPISIHDLALRLAAKARAYDRVTAHLPAAEAAPTTSPVVQKVSEALLANGVKVIAVSVEESAEGYVFKLPNGSTFAPRREDVLSVRAVERAVAPEAGGQETLDKLARVDDPVVLFVDGVQRCFRKGMPKEGLKILDRILERPDSDKVPLLFVPDADESLLNDWQLAAGRRAAPLAARTPDSDPSQPSAERAVGRPEVFDPSNSNGNYESTATAVDAESLARAGELIARARNLYQASAGKDGHEADLKAAREDLQKALGIVENLPPDDADVRKVRRQLAQLLSDIGRISPF